MKSPNTGKEMQLRFVTRAHKIEGESEERQTLTWYCLESDEEFTDENLDFINIRCIRENLKPSEVILNDIDYTTMIPLEKDESLYNSSIKLLKKILL